MSTLANLQARDALLARLRVLRPDSPRHWGRMTPHQMVCHLTDAFRMAYSERKQHTGRELRESDDDSLGGFAHVTSLAEGSSDTAGSRSGARRDAAGGMRLRHH